MLSYPWLLGDVAIPVFASFRTVQLEILLGNKTFVQKSLIWRFQIVRGEYDTLSKIANTNS